MIQKNVRYQRWLFIGLIVVMVFHNTLQNMFAPFGYLDEVLAVSLVPLFILYIGRNNYQCTIDKQLLIALVLFLLFSASGIYSNVTLGYREMPLVLQDLFLNIKFFLVIGVGYLLFIVNDIEDLFQYSWPVIKLVSAFLFILCVFDLIFKVFPAGYRYEMRSVMLIYGHQTNLVAACVFLSAILLRMYEFYQKEIFPYLCGLLFVECCTLRAKALGAVVCTLFIYFIICEGRRQFGVMTWFILIILMGAVAYRQFSFYFVNKRRNKIARSALIYVGTRIFKDRFPFGTGFGTFASSVSAEPYSKVYYLYHIHNVWGISKNFHPYISDCFWPMIMGQTGFLGLLFFVLILGILLYEIYKLRLLNIYAFASGLLLMIYLIISSTSESAFVNPFAIPFGLLLGIIFAEQDQKRGVYRV